MQSQPFLSRPVYLLRAEALCAFVGCFALYHVLFPHHWVLFACLFLVPDVSLLMYARQPNAAASTVYNAMHSYVLPAVVAILAVVFKKALLGEVSVIWVAHIAMDRMLGFGLKYPASFQFTHIQSTANPVIVSDGNSASASR